MTNSQDSAPSSPSSPSSPPLPPIPISESPSSVPSSPVLSSPSTAKPMPITIAHAKSLDLPQVPKQRGSIAAHLMSFASRSTSSLHVLSSSAPENDTSSSQDPEVQSQISSTRSAGFSNPFKKLHNPFTSSTRKTSESAADDAEKVAPSSSSVHSMVSWRSKGAEIFSKKNWSRARKNSEPTFGARIPTPIFGASLEEAVRASHIQGTPMVPAILYRCAEYLEAKGADEVGLYRVPGSHANVQKLKKMFDTGKDHNLLATEGLDPNDIATLLKLYLRELPTPLLPAVFVEQFQSVISTDRQVCHSLRGMLVRLPRPNYVVLSFLCHHLSKIASYAEKTKMNISNLGVVFAPTLSIGSVLFKALLGGYYDPVESLDSREKGLKIVWSGLVQDFDNPQDWSDDTMSQDGLSTPMLTPAQELVNATKGPSASASSTAPSTPTIQTAPTIMINPITTAPTTPTALVAPTIVFEPTTPITPSATSPLTEQEIRPIGPLDPVIMEEVPGEISDDDDDGVEAEDEEAKLMAAMLLREELATKGQEDDETASNASSSSDSIPCTETTALSAVSSPGVDVKDQSFESTFTSPELVTPSASSPPSDDKETATVATPTTTTATAVSYPEPPKIDLAIDAGATLDSEVKTTVAPPSEPAQSDVPTEAATEEEEKKDEEEDDTLQVSEFAHKRISVAPQLPPLEGLMIAL